MSANLPDTRKEMLSVQHNCPLNNSVNRGSIYIFYLNSRGHYEIYIVTYYNISIYSISVYNLCSIILPTLPKNRSKNRSKGFISRRCSQDGKNLFPHFLNVKLMVYYGSVISVDLSI